MNRKCQLVARQRREVCRCGLESSSPLEILAKAPLRDNGAAVDILAIVFMYLD